MTLVYTDGKKDEDSRDDLQFLQYSHDKEKLYLSRMRDLISESLSEPYSIYVFRYFLSEWADLCFLAIDRHKGLVGVIICKLETHSHNNVYRGYIAMLVVLEAFRGRGIATQLVRLAIDAMIEQNADEICLETEVVNKAATKLYERLGFLKSKRLHRYYLNGNSAFRLLLPLKDQQIDPDESHERHETRLSDPPSP